MDDAKAGIRLSFPWSVTQFFHNFQATFQVVYSSFKIFQTVMSDAKVAIRLSFPWSVTQFFGNF